MDYPKDVIERAARRLYASAEDPDVAPGVYTLDFFRERVTADPGDYVIERDNLRCEFYAEAGEQCNENGEPTCNDPVTKAVYVSEDVDCDGFIFSCDVHAEEIPKDPDFGFIRTEPLRGCLSSEEAANAQTN